MQHPFRLRGKPDRLLQQQIRESQIEHLMPAECEFSGNDVEIKTQNAVLLHRTQRGLLSGDRFPL